MDRERNNDERRNEAKSMHDRTIARNG